MRGKSVALLVLALGCGLVASLGITQVLAKRGDSSPPPDTMPVFVAKADISIGALINDENSKIEQWPKDKVPAGSVIRQEDLDGRHARQKIFAGEPIIEPKLLAHGQVPTDSLVPKGLRVVPVPVGFEAIHSGLVLPGTRCDVQVFIRADPSIGIGETLCKTILQDIKVFAVNDATSTESGDPKSPEVKSLPTARTVSLLVTPTQAQTVTLASQLGTIRLILRSGDDSETPKSLPMTAHELIGAYGASDRPKENQVDKNEKDFMRWAEDVRKKLQENAKDPVKARSAEEERRFTMRIRNGVEVNDVVLINNSAVQGLPGDEGAWTTTGLVPSARSKAGADTHPAKSVDVMPSAGLTLPKPGGSPLLIPPISPGSLRSPDGPFASPPNPQSPSG